MRLSSFISAHRIAWTAIAGVLAGQPVTPAHAQRVAAAAQIPPTAVVLPRESAAPRNVLATVVTVDYRNVTLQAALDDIIKQSGVAIFYSPVVVPVGKVVSVRVTNGTLESVLSRMLEGTHTALRVVEGNKVVIARADGISEAIQGVITGKVTDAKTGRAIAGATVLLDNATKGVVTGDDGTFRISASVGEHIVTVRAVGFVKEAKQVVVSDGQTINVTMSLAPSTSVLSEVVVTGTVVATERKAIPNPITVITAADIEKRGVTQVGQLLRGEVPGVVALDMGSMSYANNWQIGKGPSSTVVYSRGVSNVGGGVPASGPLKTYIDGVELLDPTYLGTIDPKTIERIEIITGPQAATVYGSGAIGGVMQIFTKNGSGRTTPEATLSLKYGVIQNNFSSGKTPQHLDALSLTGGTGPEFTYSGNLSYNYMGQWQPMLYNRSIGASIGATHVHGPFRVAGSVSTTTARNGTYSVDPYSVNRYAIGAQRQTSNSSRVPSQITSGATSQTFSLNADYQPSRFWQHHMTVGRSQNNFELEPEAPRFGTPRDTLYTVQSSSGLRTTMGYNTTLIAPPIPHVSSTLTLGATGSWGDQTQVSGTLITKTASSYSGSPSVSRPIIDESWGGFGQWQIGMFDRLYFTFGLRGERNPTYGEAHKIDWTPTNGVTYTAEYNDLTVKLLASYGRATRAPNASSRLEQVSVLSGYSPERYIWQRANPDLTPEYSRGPQGGIEIYYGNLLSFTVNRYTQKITDVVFSIYVDSQPYLRLSDGVTEYLYTQQNVNTAVIRQFGWEGTGSVTLGPLSVKGTMSWSDSRTIGMDPRTTFYGGGWSDPFIDVAPPRYGNVTVSYAHGPTSITLVSNIMGKTLAASYNNGALYNLNGSESYSQYSRRVSPVEFYSVVSGYTKSDLALSHRLSRSATATVNVTNLTNTYRSDIWATNAAIGRQTLLGMSLTFPRR